MIVAAELHCRDNSPIQFELTALHSTIGDILHSEARRKSVLLNREKKNQSQKDLLVKGATRRIKVIL